MSWSASRVINLINKVTDYRVGEQVVTFTATSLGITNGRCGRPAVHSTLSGTEVKKKSEERYLHTPYEPQGSSFAQSFYLYVQIFRLLYTAAQLRW
jgi:hypothetical protein